MGQVTVSVDEDLITAARSTLRTRTRSQTVAEALRRASGKFALERLLKHKGKIDLGVTRKEILRRREET